MSAVLNLLTNEGSHHGVSHVHFGDDTMSARQYPELFWLKMAMRRTWQMCEAEVKGSNDFEQWIMLRLKALVFLGFWTCLDCKSLVSLEVEHIQLQSDFMTVALPGAGRRLRLPRLEEFCAHHAARTWLTHSGLVKGPLFPRIIRDRRGNVSLQARPLHPMGAYAMLESVWGGVRQVSSLSSRSGAMRWDEEAGWFCPDRRRLDLLAKAIGINHDTKASVESRAKVSRETSKMSR